VLDDVVEYLAACEKEAVPLAGGKEGKAVDEVLEGEDRRGRRFQGQGRPSSRDALHLYLLERFDHGETVAEPRRVERDPDDLRRIDYGEAVRRGLGVLHRGHDDPDPGGGEGGHVLHVHGRIRLGDGLVDLLLEVGEGVAVDRSRDEEEEPVVLDRRSPVLHLVQLIRDESHRFAVGYHRQRRAMRDRDSELLTIPGVGPQTRQRLLTHFGSLRDVQQATAESLAAVVPRKTAETIWRHFHEAIR